MRASLFVTCLADTLFPQAARATVAVLERVGVAVDFPAEQTCCGQLHANSGFRREARPLVARFVRVFERSEWVVAPSASCAAMVHDQYEALAAESEDADLLEAVRALRPRVRELSQFLTEQVGTDDVGASFPHRVTYHPTCHSLRLLRVGDAPLRLLRAVRGIELVDLPGDRECCGFGGTFAVKNPDVSTAMLADKQRHVLDTGAEVLCAADASCLMHIGGGLRRLRAGVRTMHLAEVLAAREGAPA